MGQTSHTHETSSDFHNHRETYEGFLRLSSIASAWALCIVVGLAIGGTSGHWGIASVIMAVATIASVLGLAVKGWDWRPGAALLVLGLLTLLLVSY